MLDTMIKAFAELKNAIPRSKGVCFIPEEEFENIKAKLDESYNNNEVKYGKNNPLE